MKEEILELYLQGKSGTELAKIYKKDPSTIYKYIRELGGEIRPSTKASQKYYVNENYFSNIDNEEKAYWLGFIYADGCITGRRLQIGLSSIDIDHLNKFKNHIEYEGPLHFYKSTTNKDKQNVILQIANQHIIRDLIKLGITKNKTFTLKFPDYLNDNLIKHFIRGYFDGDGGLSFRKGVFQHINICGTVDFLNSLQDIFISNLGLTKVKIIKDRTIFKYSKGGKTQGGLILKYLYEDCKISLFRKHKLASPLIE